MQVEAALSQLLDMANEDPNSVPVLLALATGVCVCVWRRAQVFGEFHSMAEEAQGGVLTALLSYLSCDLSPPRLVCKCPEYSLNCAFRSLTPLIS